MRPAKTTSGFSLIELCIVLVIAGLLLAVVAQVYMIYAQKKSLSDTFARQTSISAAIARFYAENGRYPCPAIPSLGRYDANVGREHCPAAVPAMGACDAGLCRAAGRDTDLDGNPNAVLIGDVPFVTLSIAMTDTYDGWGRKFSYAVTELLTSNATFNEGIGAIGVVKEDGVSLVNPADSAHLVIVSTGQDGKGGYLPDGGLFAPCATAQLDGENCDADARFMSGLRADAAGPSHFDDIMQYKIWTMSSLWSFAPSNPNNIYNRNPGNVGVGTTTPQQKLDVNGNIRADEAHVERLCDNAGLNCFAPGIIGGAGINCAGGAMTGIANAAPVCANLLPPSGANPGTCPGGEYMVGLDAAGNILCGP